MNECGYKCIQATGQCVLREALRKENAVKTEKCMQDVNKDANDQFHILKWMEKKFLSSNHLKNEFEEKNTSENLNGIAIIKMVYNIQ